MTQLRQKNGERFFVEEAAKLLGKEWHLGDDREIPDFIVTEGTEEFGLEVVEIFTGPQNEHGAHLKKGESDTQKAVNILRDEYQEKDNAPLIVKLVGDMCHKNTAAIIPALREMNLSTKPFGHQDRIDVQAGKAKLSVYVTRALRTNWFYVNDQVGWVDRNPITRIANAIEDKAKKLSRYKRGAGSDDIRLLVVANRRMNSGKLSLQDCPAMDLLGFQFVYFLSSPESVKVFECVGHSREK